MSLFAELDIYEESAAESAAMNMALDEALFELAATPSLRFYRWRAPSVSFGYFGKFAEVESEMTRREIVRRWTGGGIVWHGSDLTYALVWPASAREKLAAARVVYLQVHDAIRRALASQIASSLAAKDSPKLSDACFANPVAADLLADGKKIAGAAQRRTRQGLLHQGSIQNIALPASFTDAFAAELCENFVRQNLPAPMLDRAHALADKKYASESWLRRR